MLDLSVVIISFNTKEILIDCIKSVVKNTRGVKYEIVVIDNASSDGSSEAISYLSKSVKVVTLIRNSKNVGFAAANNQGYRASKGKYILFLNSDTLVSGNVLGDVAHWMDTKAKVGICSCMLKNKDGTIQGTGGYFPTLPTVFSWMTIQDLPYVDNFIKPFHPMKPKSFSKDDNFYKNDHELDWVTGAFLFVRRSILDNVGGWNDDYFMYMEEVDLCFRVKKLGWQIWYLPDWSIVHLGGASCSSEYSVLSEYKGIKIFYKKYFPAWQLPVLRLLLKVGALGRMVLFGILEGEKSFTTYAKAFQLA